MSKYNLMSNATLEPCVEKTFYLLLSLRIQGAKFQLMVSPQYLDL